MKEAVEIAKEFFEIAREEKERLKVLYEEVGNNKGLMGWNSPNEMKELFRIRRERGEEFPWPSLNSFKERMERALEVLEKVLNS